jgi:Cys-rich protein (TIGR01571 family)
MVKFKQGTSDSKIFLWTKRRMGWKSGNDYGQDRNWKAGRWSIKEGEKFLTPIPASMQDDRIQAPTGKWKDGLCDYFSVGICHPSLWCAFCCPRISMAQVMTRMSPTWLGEHGQRVATQNTFKVVVLLWVSYLLFSTSLKDYTPGKAPLFIITIKVVGSTFSFLWALYSLCQTRQNVRAQYSIPEERCVGCEDL